MKEKSTSKPINRIQSINDYFEHVSKALRELKAQDLAELIKQNAFQFQRPSVDQIDVSFLSNLSHMEALGIIMGMFTVERESSFESLSLDEIKRIETLKVFLHLMAKKQLEKMERRL